MEDKDIAIIGAGCRFPGADNIDEFWKVLVNGENHVKEIPKSRWNNDAFYDAEQTVPGKIYVKRAGLLKSHDKWDNRLFGISDLEAGRIDPQQRYVLECVHMALEDGGITKKQINGTNTGVIIGCMNDDYKVMANSDLTEIGNYNATGTATSVISARVSYVYNLHGTCLTLDTACSSSLIAIHIGAQAIRSGDCDMVLCGGVSSILNPDTFTALCQARMMSAIGQCQSFCDTADGYARGEGCGVVILKSYKRALEDGNKIWATIKTGTNQDGSTAKPMTAPSGEQQIKLFNHVYTVHRFSPSDIQYVEAHGTGTPRGDPTEVNAIGKYFSSFRKETTQPLLLGSVKSNIGHTESAAGMAGLLKMLLMMKNGKYVPSLHVKHDNSNVNKAIQLSEYNLDIAKFVQEWPCNKKGERNACLNSFGFGGSNSHAIITMKTNNSTVKRSDNDNSIFPICISGTDRESLEHNLSEFRIALDTNESSLRDISNTSFCHRQIHPYRALVFGRNVKEVQTELRKKENMTNDIIPKKNINKVFVYCGVGTTWKGMCRDLIRQNRTFRDTIERIDHYIRPLSNLKIVDTFLSDETYDDPFLNHIAIFCAQVALTEIWKSFGVYPDAIIGQSVGEVAACYAANLLSIEEAVKIIYHRSVILAKQSGGSMTVIGNLDVKCIEEECIGHGNDVCVAVYSSPNACTISGNETKVKLIKEHLKNKNESNVFIRDLKVGCAYHSPLVQGCLKQLTEEINISLKRKSPDEPSAEPISMISTVTNKPTSRNEVMTGDYWARNVRQPVLFYQGIEQAFNPDCFNIYIELGPRPVLPAHIRNIFPKSDNVITLPSMLPKRDIGCLCESLSDLFAYGVDINVAVEPSEEYQITDIPRYIFHRTGDLFIPSQVSDRLEGFTMGNSSGHMFVKTTSSLAGSKFAICIDDKSTPFVYEHFLSDKLVIPGATYVEAGFHIGMQLKEKQVDCLSVGFQFDKTFTPTLSQGHTLAVNVDCKDEDILTVSILNDGFNLATGRVSDRKSPRRDTLDINYLKSVCQNHLSKAECYNALRSLHFRYGNTLSLIEDCWTSDCGTKCLTRISLPDDIEKQLIKTHFHPAVIDSLFQMFGIMTNESMDGKNQLVVPQGVSAVVLNTSVMRNMYGYAEETKTTDNSTHYNAILLSPNGTVIAELEDFYVKIISGESSDKDKSYVYDVNLSEWNISPQTEIDSPDKIAFLQSDPGRYESTVWLRELEKYFIINQAQEPFTLAQQSNAKTLVMYHINDASTSPCNDTEDGAILGSVMKRFFDVKALLDTVEGDTPMVIITENTQSSPGRKLSNYVGSEMWGMLRSAVHEGMHRNVKLLDIDGCNVDSKTLAMILSEPVGNVQEYILCGSKVFTPRIRTSRIKWKSRRLISATNDDMSIFSSSQKEITFPYLLLAKDIGSTPHTEEITLHSFIDHRRELYLNTLAQESTNDSLLNSASDDSYRIVVIEGRGYHKQRRNDVLFLCPVNASTTVNIPTENVIDVQNCSIYIGGLLTLVNMLVQISYNIEDGTKVVVVTSSQKADIGQTIFYSIMTSKTCDVQFCTLNTMHQANSFYQDTLFLATKFSVGNIIRIVKCYPDLKKIITLDIICPELRSVMSHLFPDIQLTVLYTSDLLCSNAVRKAMPVIKKQLRLLPQSTDGNMTNEFLLKLPIETIQVHDRFQEGSLRCYCTKDTLFRCTAAYVIVGGLTGLGWELLQLMAEMGAGLLVTFSRRQPSDLMKENIKQLQQQHHCKVLPIQADIADFNSVQAAFSLLANKYPLFPIKGIFHGAGITSDSLLINMNKEMVADVMKPKLIGALNLHRASHNLPLDYFMMHSSIVSVIGNAGQCNYAAANSFLDSFALYRRSKNLPAQSINWGALSVGMAVQNNDVNEQLQRRGFGSLSINQIRQCFIEALLNDTTGVVYADIEWSMLLSLPSFSKQVLKYNDFKSVQTQDKPTIQFNIDDVLKLDTDAQRQKVKEALKEILKHICLTDDPVLADETPLAEIGIDSMTAMSLSKTIYDIFNVSIPITTVLNAECTISVITERIVEDLGCSKDGNATQPQPIHYEMPYTKHLFDSIDFTFMQMDLLEKYKKHRDNPYYLTVIDIELSGVKFKRDTWKKIFKHVLSLHVELRKEYYFSNDGTVSVEVLPDADPKLDFLTLSEVASEYRSGEDIRLKQSPDIHNSLPISFGILQKKDATLLRIIAHKVAIDMRGLSILSKDIGLTCVAIAYRRKLPVRDEVIDVCSSVKRAIQPKMTDMDLFWNRYLERPIRPISLGPGLQQINSNNHVTSNTEFPKKIVFEIKTFLSKLGISLYAFIMSLYQLYLFIGSGESIVTVGTAADMRIHVPELANVLTRCANHIPVIAEIDENISLRDFMTTNSADLSTATLNSAYPSSLILEKVKNNGIGDYIFRHFLAMNDVSTIKSSEKKEDRAKVLRVWQASPSRETSVFARFDLKRDIIKLEVTFNSAICGQYGVSLPNTLLWLAEEAMQDNGNNTIRNVRNKLVNQDVNERILPTTLKQKDVTEKRNVLHKKHMKNIAIDPKMEPSSNNGNGHRPSAGIGSNTNQGSKLKIGNTALQRKSLLISDKFKKQTRHGWDHSVQVSLYMIDGQNLTLEWGKTNMNVKRVLDVNQISEVSFRTVNGISTLMFRYQKKVLILKSPDRPKAERWMSVIEERKRALNSVYVCAKGN